METKDIERPRHSALAEYAPLSGILILAASMCLCIFLLANDVKRSGAVLVQSAPTETNGEPRALFSPVALPIAPALASSQTSSEALVMLDRGVVSEMSLSLAERGSNQLGKVRGDSQKREICGSPQQTRTGYSARQR
jgi:hypothetical protein